MGDSGRAAAGILALAVCLVPAAAHAVDEIQVYNAEIADVGQWTLQQHLNYAIRPEGELGTLYPLWGPRRRKFRLRVAR